MSGQTKCGLAGANGIAAAIAGIGIAVVAIDVIEVGWHVFIDGLTIIGAVALAWFVIKLRIWWLTLKARLTGQGVPYVVQLKQATRAERQQVPSYEQPIMQPRQQALPPAQVHHHHGDSLVLPGVTDDGLERILNRRQ